MSDRLREALAYEDGELIDVPGDTQAIIVAAARRFLALTETGQRVEWCERHGARAEKPEVKCDALRLVEAEGGESVFPCRIITAYVVPADYLTEEEI